MKAKSGKFFKIIAFLLCFLLCVEQSGFAQVAGQLDISGHLASLHNTFAPDVFRPLHLRYLSYNPIENNFQLFLDKGSLKNPSPQELEDTTKTLLNYFFVGVTLPNDTFWVNLRPDAEDQIIDDRLAQTDVGKIMLETDLQLKKDTARFTSPEMPEGKEYWDKLYKKAEEIFGSENISIPTLTRPWIVPDEIIIRETTDSAYIYKATLKVMLEQDYLKDSSVYSFRDERLKELNEYSSQLIREIIIPKLTKEVNSSKRYASLRQVYYSLIMAQWFKARNLGKDGLYSHLINRKDLTNLTSKESWSKTAYFKEYQKSFKDGEYNIQEPVYTLYGQTIRSYFSGGISGIAPSMPPFGVATFTDLKTGAKITSSPASNFPVLNPKVVIGVKVDKLGEVKIEENSSSFAQQPKQRVSSPTSYNDNIPHFRGTPPSYRVSYSPAWSVVTRLRDDEDFQKALGNTIQILHTQHVESNFDVDLSGFVSPVVVGTAMRSATVTYGVLRVHSHPSLIYQPSDQDVRNLPGGERLFYRKQGREEEYDKLQNLFKDTAGVVNPDFKPREDLKDLSATGLVIWGCKETGFFATEFHPKGMKNFPSVFTLGSDPYASEDAFVFWRLIEANGRPLGLFYREGEYRYKLERVPYAVIKHIYKRLIKADYQTNKEGDIIAVRREGLGGSVYRKFLKDEYQRTLIRFQDEPVDKIIAEIERIKQQLRNSKQPEGYHEVVDWAQQKEIFEQQLSSLENIIESRKSMKPSDSDDKSSSSAIHTSYSLEKRINDASLPMNVEENRAMGGIDFRSLPIVTQAVTNLNAEISSSAIHNLVSINLDEEWRQIDRMASSGIIPSSERIKEYIRTSCVQDNIIQDRDKIVLFISDILRLQEEHCDSTDTTLKDILVVLESVGNMLELKQVFLGKAI